MSTRVQTRVRINLSRTAKDGWIPETTTEFQWDGVGVGEEQDEESLHHIGELLRLVRLAAYKEADKRNQMEGRVSVWRYTGEDAPIKASDRETAAIMTEHGLVDQATGEILG